MRFHLVACDYDGTLAHDGRLAPSTEAALRHIHTTGRRLLLVSGRQRDDLASCFDDPDAFFGLFDRLVLENGAVLYDPGKRETKRLAAQPAPSLLEALRARGVAPVAHGEVIVATWRPHETACLEVIRELGLEMQVIFNKGAVMLLPSGCNKASGLAAALAELGLSPHNVVAIGDGENDHALLAAAGCGVAVANAVPALKERADIITDGSSGRGVEEILEALEEDDLQAWMSGAEHPLLKLGMRAGPEASPICLGPYEAPVLIAGTSGGGKSTLATTLVERLRAENFQTCLFDPEGEHGMFDDVAELGSPEVAPKAQEVRDLLNQPTQHASVNLLAVPLVDRPAVFADIFSKLLFMRTELGRPHAIVIDEAHHCLSSSGESVIWPEDAAAHGLVLVSVHPERLPARVLQSVGTVFVVGEKPQDALRAIAAGMGVPAPQISPDPLPPAQAICWRRGMAPEQFQVDKSRYVHQRHTRKYAEGDMAEKSFFFRGPAGALNLKANNLSSFLTLGEGVDEETWTFHLARGDYDQWLRKVIKDDELADEASALRSKQAPVPELRQSLRHAVESRYVVSA